MQKKSILPSRDQLRGGAKVSLLLIIFCFLAPMVISWWFLTQSEHVRSGGKTNYGTLVTPVRTLTDQILDPVATENTALTLADTTTDVAQRSLHGQWSLLYLLPVSCDEECIQRIWLLQQIEHALGKDSLRVQRILYPQSPAQIPAKVLEYPGQWRLSKTEGVLQQLRLPEDILRWDRVYLVDPLGNIMMYYPQNSDALEEWGRGMMKDLRKLLKASKIG